MSDHVVAPGCSVPGVKAPSLTGVSAATDAPFQAPDAPASNDDGGGAASGVLHCTILADGWELPEQPALPVELVDEATSEIVEASYRLRTGDTLEGPDVVGVATALAQLTAALADLADQLEPSVDLHAQRYPTAADRLYEGLRDFRAIALGAHTTARRLRWAAQSSRPAEPKPT